MEEEIALRVSERIGDVRVLINTPEKPRVAYVFAHGAGAGMRHVFMNQMAERLAAIGVATLRFQFPYMQSGARRPDPAPVLEATVRAAINCASVELADLPLLAGGKSMGGRMTSQALSKEVDLRVRGIAFIGFPLHYPKQPARTRAEHLFDVVHPMLFLQGTRDTLADIDLMREVTDELGERARLHLIEGADHSFAMLKRSGRAHSEVLDELAQKILEFGLELA